MDNIVIAGINERVNPTVLVGLCILFTVCICLIDSKRLKLRTNDTKGVRVIKIIVLACMYLYILPFVGVVYVMFYVCVIPILILWFPVSLIKAEWKEKWKESLVELFHVLKDLDLHPKQWKWLQVQPEEKDWMQFAKEEE